MKISFYDVAKAVSEYELRYRRDDLPRLELSDEYCLFPPDPFDGVGWPTVYPNADRAGVYVIANERREVLYIGKASYSRSISARLGSYFHYEDDKKTCKVFHRDLWSSVPHWIVTIAVPSGQEFEAPALEEYLITRFKSKLPDNKIGTSPI